MTTTFVAIDFETANYAQDSACSVGLVKVVDGEIVDSIAHLIRPSTPDFVFTYIHGLSWRHVERADNFGALWPKLAPWFEGVDFLAAHNASFDRGVLRACCGSYAIDAQLPDFRCTVTLARRAWNLRPTRLPDVCRHLGIGLDHHDALSDAMACARIVIAAERSLLAKPAETRARKIPSRRG